ncbi:methyl-accepting chemotaxis protein [Salipaludibacillus daqingensis]|uniref:methyl-accepting chemotaxis protein n=1 Tax=Salipaludibacillus daqingensis TaxID=3041001 RepID=UPI002475A23E|nr:methyl-accepting chemotaxis protein [Salipaludibacillus daqingensis]
MKNLKMKMKLVVMFLITGFIPIIILSFLIINQVASQMEEETIDYIANFHELIENRINDFYEKAEADGNILASTADIAEGLEIISEFGDESSEWQDQYDLIEQLTLTATEGYGYLDIFITDPTGTIVLSSTQKELLENERLSSDIMTQSLQGEQSWSPLYYDERLDRNIIILSTPIRSLNQTNNIVGSVNITFREERIDQMAHSGIEMLGTTADSYIIDGDGTLLTNTMLGDYQENAVLNHTLSTEIIDSNKQAVHDGNMEFSYDGIYDDYLGNSVIGSSGIVRVGNQPAVLFVELDEQEALSGSIAVRNTSIILVVVVSIIGLVIAIFLATSISRPLRTARDHALTVSKLDISHDLPDKSLQSKDETGELANALQLTITNLRDMIANINEAAENVAATSEELTATSQQSASAAEEVSSAIQDIADGAQSQATNTETGAEKAKIMGDRIRDDQLFMEELNKTSDQVSEAVEQGLHEIENLSQASKHSEKTVFAVQQEIERTNESSNKIGNASQVIASIADQTNLLALNAAIEAARAGEAGKGFSVVADEIRKLAEKSSESTKVIDSMVADLQAHSNEAVEVMKEVLSSFADQQKSFSTTEERYDKIASLIEDTKKILVNLNISGADMEKAKDDIDNSLENLAAIAEQNSASTQQVAASVEEQTASTEEISSSSESLASLAEGLRNLIAKFKL